MHYETDGQNAEKTVPKEKYDKSKLCLEEVKRQAGTEETDGWQDG